MGGENAERHLSFKKKEITVRNSELVCQMEKKLLEVY